MLTSSLFTELANYFQKPLYPTIFTPRDVGFFVRTIVSSTDTAARSGN